MNVYPCTSDDKEACRAWNYYDKGGGYQCMIRKMIDKNPHLDLFSEKQEMFERCPIIAAQKAGKGGLCLQVIRNVKPPSEMKGEEIRESLRNRVSDMRLEAAEDLLRQLRADDDK